MRKQKCFPSVLLFLVLSRTIVLSCLFFIVIFFSLAQKTSAYDVIDSWSTTQSLPYIIASHIVFTRDNHIFVLGGSAVTGQSKFEILESTRFQDGNLSLWNVNSYFPTALIWHSGIAYNESVYVMGGLEENSGSAMGYVNKTFQSKLTNSVFNPWIPLTPLPQALAHGGTFIANNRLYFVGGLGNPLSDKIYSAEIKPDGTLGAWKVSGILPEPGYGMAIFEQDGIIYLLGGVFNGIGSKNVYKADLNQVDGSISGWQQLPDAPNFPSGQHTVLVGDTFVFVAHNKTYYAKILSPGVLDSWATSSQDLPDIIGAARLVYNNGYLYFIGGYGAYSGGYLNTVYYTKFNGVESKNEDILEVDLLKQTDPLWSEEIYDSADKWASSNPGIGRWGCAMTSAAMVFNYHNIKKLPDGSNLDPGNLNEWLISQPDGYVGNGLINWIALTRLSKLSKSQNPEFDYEALEYSRVNSDDQNTFKQNIDNNLPTILGEPGHFIVGKGYSDSEIFINDPAYDREDLSEYADTFLSMGTYTPSNTDLSYILITTEEGLDIELQDSLEQQIGESYIQEPIQDPSGASSLAKTLKIYYLEKPGTENYILNINSDSPKNYDIDIYLYDEKGDVIVKTVSGVVGDNVLDSIVLDFNKNDIEQSGIEEVITFDSLISDIGLYYQQGKIKNLQTKNLMIKHLELAKLFYQGKSKGGSGQLNSLKSIILGQTPGNISMDISAILIGKITLLQASL